MELARVTSPEEDGFRRAMELYALSFPIHEQRIAASQEQIMGLPEYHLEQVMEDGRFLGALFYWEIEDFLYVEHFCMDPAVRGRGLGQQALVLLAERGKPVILEIDPPVDEISKRRRGFYLRCGFQENPWPHVHPPYRGGYQGHELVVLSCPKVLEQTSYEAFFRYLRDVVMKEVF